MLRDRPGAVIVGDVKSSELLFAGIEQACGRPVMSPSGYVLVREAMLREGAPLAGEMSGHIFYRDWHSADDALHNAMRMLRALARSGMNRRPDGHQPKRAISARVAFRVSREELKKLGWCDGGMWSSFRTLPGHSITLGQALPPTRKSDSGQRRAGSISSCSTASCRSAA